MGTVVRAELSTRNKYYISRHRYYELKHFCLQYKELEEELKKIESELFANKSRFDDRIISSEISDTTGNAAVKIALIKSKLKMIWDSAEGADPDLAKWIFKAVTEDRSFNYLKTVMDMPCEKDMYYDRYRKFFWILSRKLQRL